MSLVAAAVSALFVVSTVIAVQGWPGVDPENDVPNLVLAEDVPLAENAAAPTGAGAAPAAPAPAAIVLG
ncbi:MAG: hypothetical protein M3389_01515, partial [Actinomycetota bacterium]|nr:hypothetical protein [Actinomycetota bacterium]